MEKVPGNFDGDRAPFRAGRIQHSGSGEKEGLR